MTTYNQGDVVLLAYPFTNHRTTKQRPAVIISADWFNSSRSDYVMVAVTSQVPAKLEKHEHLLSASDLVSAGLPKPSIIKLGKIATVEKSIVRRYLGKVPRSTLRSVLEGIRSIIQ